MMNYMEENSFFAINVFFDQKQQRKWIIFNSLTKNKIRRRNQVSNGNNSRVRLKKINICLKFEKISNLFVYGTRKAQKHRRKNIILSNRQQ